MNKDETTTTKGDEKTEDIFSIAGIPIRIVLAEFVSQELKNWEILKNFIIAEVSNLVRSVSLNISDVSDFCGKDFQDTPWKMRDVS